jgi:hypothetical protein
VSAGLLSGSLPAMLFCIIAVTTCVAIDIYFIFQRLNQQNVPNPAGKEKSVNLGLGTDQNLEFEIIQSNNSNGDEGQSLKSKIIQLNDPEPSKDQNLKSKVINSDNSTQNEEKKLNREPDDSALTSEIIQLNNPEPSKDQNLKSEVIQLSNSNRNEMEKLIPKPGKPKVPERQDISADEMIEYKFNDATIQRHTILNGFKEKIEELVNAFRNANDSESYNSFNELLQNARDFFSKEMETDDEIVSIYKHRLCDLLNSAECQLDMANKLAGTRNDIRLAFKTNSSFSNIIIMSNNINRIANGVPLMNLITSIRAATVDIENDKDEKNNYENVFDEIIDFIHNYSQLQYSMSIFIQNFEVAIPNRDFLSALAIDLMEYIANAFRSNSNSADISGLLTTILERLLYSCLLNYLSDYVKITKTANTTLGINIVSNLLLLKNFFTNVQAFKSDHIITNDNYEETKNKIQQLISHIHNALACFGENDIRQNLKNLGWKEHFMNSLFLEVWDGEVNCENYSLPCDISWIVNYMIQYMPISETTKWDVANLRDKLTSCENQKDIFQF